MGPDSPGMDLSNLQGAVSRGRPIAFTSLSNVVIYREILSFLGVVYSKSPTGPLLGLFSKLQN